MNLHCKKCLCYQSGMKLGEKCPSPGCDGIIERQPEWSELVERLPEPMRCGRRDDPFSMGDRVFPGDDYWEKFKSNGNRVCSYCGSLHWEDMLALVHAAATAPEDAPYGSVPEIEPSDKGYKVYVHQPGVRNAHEGGIKFYMQHVPRKQCPSCNGMGVRVYPGTPLGQTETCKHCKGTYTVIDVTEEQQAEYARAVRASRLRFDRRLYQEA